MSIRWMPSNAVKYLLLIVYSIRIVIELRGYMGWLLSTIRLLAELSKGVDSLHKEGGLSIDERQQVCSCPPIFPASETLFPYLL